MFLPASSTQRCLSPLTSDLPACHPRNKNAELLGETPLSVTYVTPVTLCIFLVPPIVAGLSIPVRCAFPAPSDQTIKEDVSMNKNEDPQSFDPFRTWREWYQKSEKQWSDALSGILGNEQFAHATGKHVQEAMHLHRMFSESMAQYLAALNLPSRTDMTALSDRIGGLEDTVAGLQVEVRHLRRSLADYKGGAAYAASIRPKRTKKPKGALAEKD